jgi:hypothetical protein
MHAKYNVNITSTSGYMVRYGRWLRIGGRLRETVPCGGTQHTVVSMTIDFASIL